MTDDYREGGTLILQRPIGPSDEKKAPTGDACLVNLHPPGPDIGKRVPLMNMQYIVGRDSEAGFVVSRAARALGMPRTTLMGRLQALGSVRDTAGTTSFEGSVIAGGDESESACALLWGVVGCVFQLAKVLAA